MWSIYPASNGNPGTGTPSLLGNGFIQPVDVAVDSAGDVFVADLGNIGAGMARSPNPGDPDRPTTTRLRPRRTRRPSVCRSRSR